ncbi:MAG: hypothetical protein ACRDQY_10585 [Pseudonocardiaceae bacterium]
MSCERRPLTEADREEVSRGVAGGLEGTVIAARIGWSAGVVSREITATVGMRSVTTSSATAGGCPASARPR